MFPSFYEIIGRERKLCASDDECRVNGLCVKLSRLLSCSVLNARLENRIVIGQRMAIPQSEMPALQDDS